MIASPVDLRSHIKHCVAGGDLKAHDMEHAVGAIADGLVTPAQTSALLVALALKGEIASELAGAARALRARCVPLVTNCRPLMDVCGTGGDAAGSFNVSSATAFVVAGAGVRVAKHGNRAMSSSCGSADVMEAMGVAVDASPEMTSKVLERDGIGFLFAQAYHPSLRAVAGVRREIAVRTLFNLVGPLANPCMPDYQIIGVSDGRALRAVAQALSNLGCSRCAAVRADDGMDEISLSVPSTIVEWTGSEIIEYSVEPQTFGVATSSVESVRGGDAAMNAAVILSILNGVNGPQRDIVVMNSALALYIAHRAGTLAEGAQLARATIDSGAAKAKLEALRAGSQLQS
jgi:anthranilate phosphoribosyltransferase